MNGDQLAAPMRPLATESADAAQRIERGVTASGRRGRLIRRSLLFADSLGLMLAFVATALWFGLDAGKTNHLALGAEYLLFLATLPGWALAAKMYELYDRDEERAEHSTLDDFVAVLHLVTLGAWLLYVAGRLSGLINPELAKVATFWALSLIFVTSFRSIARTYCKRQPAWIQNALVIGAGEVGQLVARKFQQHPEYGIKLVGFVDSDPLDLRSDLVDQRVIGTIENLAQIVHEHNVERVVLAFSNDSTATLIDVVRLLKRLDVQVDIVPRLFDAVGPNVVVHSAEGLPLLTLPSSKLLPFSRGLKRSVDIVVAGSMLLLSAPFFAVAAFLIRRDSPGPVFFRQLRLGQAMNEFTVLKFRSMKVDTEDGDHREFIRTTMSSNAAVGGNGLYKLDRDHAITRVGKWLRKTSLDELPQLLNVLRGEMSLVGPRPCLRYETEDFAPHHFERFLVPAGLTGLWQVTARAKSTFGEALEMDVSYARNWSLGLDLWLLLRTPVVLLRGKGTT